MTAEFLFCSSAPTWHRIADDDSLDEDKQKLIDQFTADFYTAEANNDVAGMQAAHDSAVAVRLGSPTYETVSRTDYTTGSEIVIVKGNNGLWDDLVGEMVFPPSIGKAGGSILGKFTGKIFKSIGSLIGKLLSKGTGKVGFSSIQKLESHFVKHGGEFKGAYSTAEEYLQGARDVMRNGAKVTYEYKGEVRTGYVRFMGNDSRGMAKFEFVGTNKAGAITTYHVESGNSFWRMLNGEVVKVINPID